MKEKSKSKKASKNAGKLKHSPVDLEELQHDELSGHEEKQTALAASSTDEDEDEGLGDGNMGRSKKNILSK